MSRPLACTLILSLGLVGCGSSSGSSPDRRATVEITSPIGTQTGVVTLAFTLKQRSSLSADILPEYSLDGGVTYQRASGAPGGLVEALASDPMGLPHTFPWDPRADGVALAGLETNVKFRITPFTALTGVEGETDPFSVDNTSTVLITSISPDWGQIGDTITIDGQGFSTLLGDNDIAFGDLGGGGIQTIPLTSSSTRLTVMVPDPTPMALRDLSGPLTVTVLAQKSNAVQFVAVMPGSPRISVSRPTSIEGNSLPWHAGGAASVKIQLLYTASEIGSAGLIDGLRWATSEGLSGSNPDTVTLSTVSVHMVHTTLSKPSHIQELNYDVAPPREVATISNYTIPANTRGFVDIPFNPGAVFPYNGRDNLLIEIEGFGSTGLYYWNIGRRPEVRRTWAFAGGNVGKDIVFPAIEVSFQETDTDDSYSVVMAAVFDLNRNGPCEPPGCIPPAVDKVLPATGSRIQVLLLSREISGTGMVKGVAWKPPSATSSVGATYQDLSVSVGNLFLNTMSPTFVSTLTQVRAPAPYTVPAGETGFIPIPLDLPLSFLYDGTQNLVVEIKTASGTALNLVDSMNISPEQRLVTAGIPGAASGSVVADMISMRLEFD